MFSFSCESEACQDQTKEDVWTQSSGVQSLERKKVIFSNWLFFWIIQNIVSLDLKLRLTQFFLIFLFIFFFLQQGGYEGPEETKIWSCGWREMLHRAGKGKWNFSLTYNCGLFIWTRKRQTRFCSFLLIQTMVGLGSSELGLDNLLLI